jgi:hypothetical protein
MRFRQISQGGPPKQNERRPMSQDPTPTKRNFLDNNPIMEIIKRITEENEKSRCVDIQNITSTNISTGRAKSEGEKKNPFSFVKFPGNNSSSSRNSDTNKQRGLYFRKTMDIFNKEAAKTDRNVRNEALEAVIEETDKNFKTDRIAVKLCDQLENFTVYEKERFQTPSVIKDSFNSTVKNGKITKMKKKKEIQTQKNLETPFKPWTPEVSESSILD